MKREGGEGDLLSRRIEEIRWDGTSRFGDIAMSNTQNERSSAVVRRLYIPIY